MKNIDLAHIENLIEPFGLLQNNSVASASDKLIELLNSHNVPSTILTLLSKFTPQQPFAFQEVTILSDEGLIQENSNYPELLDAGFMVVGVSPCGDLFVLDYGGEGRIGLLDHSCLDCDREAVLVDLEKTSPCLERWIEDLICGIM